MNYEIIEEMDFKGDTLATIEQADAIIQEFNRQGYTLSLRQLYYQFVARALIENTERSYKNLGKIITNGRLAGKLPWDGIEDRGRDCHRFPIEEDPAEALNGVEQGITFDFWRRQESYVECWIEKEALASIIRRPCNNYRVPYMACKGYLSASEMYSAAERFRRAEEYAIPGSMTVLHMGDHDPSGIDMTRDNIDRLVQYSGCTIKIKRLALNMDQITRYNPPPNPAKITDTRAKDYIAKFGTESWELDALQPQVIEQLVTNEIRSLIDMDRWNETAAEEEAEQVMLAKLAPNWESIKQLMEENGI